MARSAMKPTAQTVVTVTAIPAVSRWDHTEESGDPCNGRRSPRLDLARNGLDRRPDGESGDDMSDNPEEG